MPTGSLLEGVTANATAPRNLTIPKNGRRMTYQPSACALCSTDGAALQRYRTNRAFRAIYTITNARLLEVGRMAHLRAVALTVAVGLALLSTQGGTAAAPGSLLTLDPQEGPPGTTVRVTPMLTTSLGECVAFWDGQEAARFTCGADPSGIILWTQLTVPATAAPGQHTITVCRDCGDVDSEWKRSAPFTVLAVVPDLGTLHLPEARDRLGQATLALGSVQGPAADSAAHVVGQDPPPGTAVDPRSVVNVTVAVPALVRVPDLLGRTRAQAERLLTSNQLELRVRSGSGRVATQQPRPGSQVPPGSV